MLPSPGTLSMVERTFSDMRPAMAKLWPSPRRTVVSAWREVSPGMKIPLAWTPFAGSMSLTSAATFRLMVPWSSTVGVKPSWMPNFFQVTLSAPSDVASGMGISPPARNFASWPVSVASDRLGEHLGEPVLLEKAERDVEREGRGRAEEELEGLAEGRGGEGGRLAREARAGDVEVLRC